MPKSTPGRVWTLGDCELVGVQSGQFPRDGMLRLVRIDLLRELLIESESMGAPPV